MIIRFLTVFFTFLLVIINVDVSQANTIAVVEHISNDISANHSLDPSGLSVTEKALIRVTRFDAAGGESIANVRLRRGVVDTDDIWGMAKTVAISVFVLIGACIICCVVTSIYICYKCCCDSNNTRKRNQGFPAVPQPIIIQTSPANYHPHAYQQQAPSPQPPLPAQTTWSLENHPMLPQPSAPPQPLDDFGMDRPPPYEKICGNA